jgi:hypothetical protein
MAGHVQVARGEMLDRSIKTSRTGVVGAVLISGVYGYTTIGSKPYYGDDLAKRAQRQPCAHVGESRLPFFIGRRAAFHAELSTTRKIRASPGPAADLR